jgi:hypothetical protein
MWSTAVCNYQKNSLQKTLTQLAKIRPIWSPWQLCVGQFSLHCKSLIIFSKMAAKDFPTYVMKATFNATIRWDEEDSNIWIGGPGLPDFSW